jgi:hypothetical protein
MNNNLSKINTIYKSLISLLILSVCGLALFVYFVDPFANYLAPYQFFVGLTVVLFLIIVLAILHVRLKVLKNLSFVEQIYKQLFNSFVFACSFTFLLLLIYSGSLSLVTFAIFVTSITCYCIFEFLE